MYRALVVQMEQLQPQQMGGYHLILLHGRHREEVLVRQLDLLLVHTQF